MTDQIPQDTVAPREIIEAFSSTYGVFVGQLTLEKLTLEKQNEMLQAHIANVEAAIAGLKAENSRLKEELEAQKEKAAG